MASLNKVFLIGNLTRDPELKYTTNGSAVCEIGMAINRTYTTAAGEKREDPCFVDVNVWGKQAEACDKYLKKGAPLFVEGRLQLDQWTDKETQKQRSRLRVVADRTQFLGSPGRSSEMGNDFHQNATGGGSFQQEQQPPSQDAQRQQNNAGEAPAAYNAGFNQQQPAPAPAAAPAPAQPTPAPAAGAFPAAPASAPAAPMGQNDPFSPKIEGSEDDIPF